MNQTPSALQLACFFHLLGKTGQQKQLANFNLYLAEYSLCICDTLAGKLR